jgi:large conductance mechanosensitive channel
MRGNVIDLAVAVVIGAAFGAVVTSFVEDILTPLIGIFGADSLENLTVDVGPAVLRYGEFLTALISFLLVAAAIYFFVIKPMNVLEERRQRGSEETPTTKTCTECASEIPFTARRCPMCTQPQAAA